MKLNGRAVAAKRTLLGLTQVELGERVGVSEMTIVSWERGHTGMPRPKRLSALARALRTDERDLVVLDESEQVA
jgi:transcriptional regulator with XRE-family HTH domain